MIVVNDHGEVNITSRSRGDQKKLSNFWTLDEPFDVDGIACLSAEGPIQAMKIADEAEQRRICMLNGRDAKMAGKLLKEALAVSRKVYWCGKEFEFRGPEHQALIRRIIRAKFAASAEARAALLETGNYPLVHKGPFIRDTPMTSLCAADFCRILHEIRDELQRGSFPPGSTPSVQGNNMDHLFFARAQPPKRIFRSRLEKRFTCSGKSVRAIAATPPLNA